LVAKQRNRNGGEIRRFFISGKIRIISAIIAIFIAITGYFIYLTTRKRLER
jgi:hypothetical protein